MHCHKLRTCSGHWPLPWLADLAIVCQYADYMHTSTVREHTQYLFDSMYFTLYIYTTGLPVVVCHMS